MDSPDTPSLAHGRLCIVLAAVLWSTSGFFAKALTQDTFVQANEPAIEPYVIDGYRVPVQMACYRTLFAALALTPTLRRRDFSFRPMMLVSALLFAVMNLTFVTALALGTSANAILLQYSAPLWMYLAAVFLLGETADRRGTIALILGLVGIGIIVGGGWTEGDLVVSAIGLASGLTYAGVLICLRVLRDVSSRWLTVWNQAWSALVLLPLVLTLHPPTWFQYVLLFFFGAFQLALAYWLVARGLRVVSPQEAGTICLLEPILNPLWAYLVSPATEVPHPATFLGGGVILAALAWRYWPRRT